MGRKVIWAPRAVALLEEAASHIEIDSLTAAAVHRGGSKPPVGGVRSAAPAFRRGKRPPPIRARVAGGRNGFLKKPLRLKSVARYAGSLPGR